MAQLLVASKAPIAEKKGIIDIVRRPAPGRLRIAVRGLRFREDRKRLVEQVISSLRGVTSVHASSSTGNALVEFDPIRVDETTLLIDMTGILTHLFEHTDHYVTENGLPHIESPDFVPDTTIKARVSTIAGPDQSPRKGTNRLVWHALTPKEVCNLVDVDCSEGLSQRTAETRLSTYGANRLPQPSPTPFLRLFSRQLANVPCALLIAGAALSVATGGLADAFLISSVLVANALTGAVTERSGERGINALRKQVQMGARVHRDGYDRIVKADELVPGDIIKLQTGDPVPADSRLICSDGLQIEESALTGESLPVSKEVGPVMPQSAIADRLCMAYRGTTVVAGSGEAVVIGTGANTIIGQVRLAAARASPPPAPLQRDLDNLGRRLGTTTVGIIGACLGLAVLRRYGLVHSLATAVALGVAAIPEGLAAIATMVLSLGARRMQKKGIYIRSVRAAETLGSVTVVCFDKTGTITENRMAAREFVVNGHVISIDGPALASQGSFRYDGIARPPDDVPGLIRALQIAAVCNNAEVIRLVDNELEVDGSPTEAALLAAAVKAGLDPIALGSRHPRVDGRYRSFGNRRMITIHQENGSLVAFSKGSPEEILRMCNFVVQDERLIPLDSTIRSSILSQNVDMAGLGLRVLALAERELSGQYSERDFHTGFVWRGLIGLADPIRPNLSGAIAELHRAGIRTIMITGDQAETARAVARELMLSRHGSLRVLDVNELSSISPENLRGTVKDFGIFVRVSPETKLAIVKALQANGKIVAMTGDGVNDAPALRAADIGVAMGERGTELAREIADAVLYGDDLYGMVYAVEEGRLLRHNVRNTLYYLLATNAAEVWTVLISIALGMPCPFTPMQLLWLNIVTDFGPAIGLATEPAPMDLMAQPPRNPKEPLLPRRFWRRLLFDSTLMAMGAGVVYGLGMLRYGPGAAARTMSFTSLSTAQLLHVFIARNGRKSEHRRGKGLNKNLLFGFGISALLALAATFFPPLRSALGGSRIGLIDVGIALAGALLPLALIKGSRSIEPYLPQPRALPQNIKINV